MSGDSPLPPPGTATGQGQGQASVGGSAASSRAAKNKLKAETDKSAATGQPAATSGKKSKKSTAGATSIPTSPKESLIRRELEQVVLRACAETGLDEISALLLVSGGVDSMVLLHLLAGLRQDILIPPSTLIPEGEGEVSNKPIEVRLLRRLHAITFQSDLRTAEAKLDTATIEETCRQLSVPFSMRELHIETLTQTAGRTVNAKAELRAARYLAAQRHAASLGCNVILTGHHGDDRIETFLWKLAEGKTPSALLSPRVYDPESGWLRPLLTVRKETLRAYAKETGLAFHEDSMNTDRKYLRTRIRHEVLPELRKTFPAVESSLLAFRDRLEVFYTLTDKLLAQSGGARVVGKAIALGTPLLSAEEFFLVPERKAILHRLLQRAYPMRRFSHGELHEIFRKLEGLAPSQRVPSPSTPNLNPNFNSDSNSNSIPASVPIPIPIGRKMLFALPLRQSSLEEDFLREDSTSEVGGGEGVSSSTQKAPIVAAGVAAGKIHETEEVHETEEIHYSRGIIGPLVTRRLIQVEAVPRSQSSQSQSSQSQQSIPPVQSMPPMPSMAEGGLSTEKDNVSEDNVSMENAVSISRQTELSELRAELSELRAELAQLGAGLSQIEAELPQLGAGLSQIEAKLPQLGAELPKPQTERWVKQLYTARLQRSGAGGFFFAERTGFAEAAIVWEVVDSSTEGLERLNWRGLLPQFAKQHRHEALNDPSNDFFVRQRLFEGVPSGSHPSHEKWDLFAQQKFSVDSEYSHRSRNAHNSNAHNSNAYNSDDLHKSNNSNKSNNLNKSDNIEREIQLRRLVPGVNKEKYLFRGKNVLWEKIFATLKLPVHCLADAWEVSITSKELIGDPSMEKDVSAMEMSTESSVQPKSFSQVLGVCSPYGWFLRANECLPEFSNNLILFGGNLSDQILSKADSTSDRNADRKKQQFDSQLYPKKELILSAYVFTAKSHKGRGSKAGE